MILQSLASYYDRLLAEGQVQPEGLSTVEVHWAVEIDPDGTFVALTRLGEGKRGKPCVAPAPVKRAVNIAANLMWDNAEYVLGAPRSGLNDNQLAKVPQRHAAFVDRLRLLPEATKADPGVAAVLAFLDNGLAAAQADENWPRLAEETGNVSFRRAGSEPLVCESPAIHAAATEGGAGPEDADETWCLFTGKRAQAARLHPSVKGVRGGQPTGGNIVSFNLPAFTSHGWKQGLNAPVSESAANAYVAALNHLLARGNDSRHYFEGDTSFVFWAARKTQMENAFAHLLGGAAVEERENDAQEVKSVFQSARTGLTAFEDDGTPFYVLGLSPNAARIAVRFWYEGTVSDIAQRFKAHFADLEVADPNGKVGNLGLWRLLGAASYKGDAKTMQDNLRGLLAAEIVSAILKGTPYPHTLLARTVERCRSEQSVWPVRAALIKAVLNRRIRQSTSNEKEVSVSLDPDNANPGYLLGRLFAVLEDIQRGAQPNINTTIRDRYFGAAIASPRSVFVQLDKLKNAHLKKLKRANPGHAVNAEKRLGAIMDMLNADTGFPAMLNLDDQGRFILGYHHQLQSFFTRADKEASQ